MSDTNKIPRLDTYEYSYGKTFYMELEFLFEGLIPYNSNTNFSVEFEWESDRSNEFYDVNTNPGVDVTEIDNGVRVSLRLPPEVTKDWPSYSGENAVIVLCHESGSNKNVIAHGKLKKAS